MMIFNRITYLILVLFLSGCSWQDSEQTDTYDLLFLDRAGAQIPMHIHGNAESNTFIVVLHGGPGGHGLEYRHGVFSEILEKEFAVVYIDQRGQGMAQGHLDPENMTVGEMVKDVEALTELLKFKYGENISLFLLGHSWGGTLGTAFMTSGNNQELYKGWIEVDGAHDFRLLIKSQIRLIEHRASLEIAGGRSVEFWEDFLEEASKIDTFNVNLDQFGMLNGLAYEAEQHLAEADIIRDGTADYLNLGLLVKSTLLSVNPLTSYISGNFTNLTLFLDHDLFNIDISSKLQSIEIPTLLLWGAHDFVVPTALGNQAFQRISSEHKKLVIFEESGHSPMVSEGELFSLEVIEFINAHR